MWWKLALVGLSGVAVGVLGLCAWFVWYFNRNNPF